jgi:hypothetical protein
VEIPGLAQGKLTLSSLFLMKDDGPTPAALPPAGKFPPLRPVQAHRVYTQAESLYVQFFAYNLEPGREEFATQAEIWRGGELLAASAPEPMTARYNGGSAPHTRKIKLRPFEPGDYEVRIVLTDEKTSVTASQRAGFTIE